MPPPQRLDEDAEQHVRNLLEHSDQLIQKSRRLNETLAEISKRQLAAERLSDDLLRVLAKPSRERLPPVAGLKLRVLCVEDQDASAEVISLFLEGIDSIFEVGSASTGSEALELLESTRYDAFVLDLSPPGVGAVELCRRIKAKDDSSGVLFYTGRGDETAREMALDAGADGYLVKPDDIDRLGFTLARLLRYGEYLPRRPLLGRTL
jgi:CheY-like chemotaxis protein